MNIQKIRARILVFLAHDVGLPYFKLTRKRTPFPYSQDLLARMPEGTVGKTLADFLNSHSLHLLKYYERHDIRHLILDYPPTAEGEICLQFFMLANGRITLPVLATVIFGLLTMVEYYPAFIRTWKRGRKTISLQKTDWYGLMPLPLSFVREQIFIYGTCSLSRMIPQYKRQGQPL